tara:strand:- start:1546 stop:1905 length:360 start_codon:yes stop_codon:yes gene_type:complete
MHEVHAYFALNILNPFTYDAKSERDGLLIAETFNQRRKKQLKSWDLFPYLKSGTPQWLSDPLVQKARVIIENLRNASRISKQPLNLEGIHKLINEEIEIEMKNKRPNILKVSELRGLIT